jgi:hypothetical protein
MHPWDNYLLARAPTRLPRPRPRSRHGERAARALGALPRQRQAVPINDARRRRAGGGP